MSKVYFAGHEVLGTTYLPRESWAKGRMYFWMKDVDGTIYLIKAKPKVAGSVDGGTGEMKIFTNEWEPDFS